MIKIVINKKPIQFPTCWDDLTFKQYLATFHVERQVQAISLFTGIDEDILKKAQIPGVDVLVEATKFIWSAPNFKDKYEKIGPYPWPVNKKGIFDIQIESLGQFEDMRLIMNQKIEEAVETERVIRFVEKYPKYIAIYLQKIRDKEYDHNKAMEMAEEIMSYPAGEVVTLGSFFILRLRSLLPGTGVASQTSPPIRKKSKAASKTSKKGLGRMPQSRKSRRK